MELTEEQFDALFHHTIRIEMMNGMVLMYGVSTVEKQRVINRLRMKSDAFDSGAPLVFLYFQTYLQRNVVVRVSEIVRVIFCFDAIALAVDPNSYYDNFKVLEKDTNLIEEATPEGKVALKVVTEEFLPSAIIQHKGNAALDGYDANPLLYYDLEAECLGTFNLELDDDNIVMRQFINLMDMDGEANFIAVAQISVMEFEDALLTDFDYEDDEIEEAAADGNAGYPVSDDEKKVKPGDLPRMPINDLPLFTNLSNRDDTSDGTEGDVDGILPF